MDSVKIDLPLEQLDAVIDTRLASGSGRAIDQTSGGEVELTRGSWTLQLAPHASQVVRWSRTRTALPEL